MTLQRRAPGEGSIAAPRRRHEARRECGGSRSVCRGSLARDPTPTFALWGYTSSAGSVLPRWTCIRSAAFDPRRTEKSNVIAAFQLPKRKSYVTRVAPLAFGNRHAPIFFVRQVVSGALPTDDATNVARSTFPVGAIVHMTET